MYLLPKVVTFWYHTYLVLFLVHTIPSEVYFQMHPTLLVVMAPVSKLQHQMKYIAMFGKTSCFELHVEKDSLR